MVIAYSLNIFIIYTINYEQNQNQKKTNTNFIIVKSCSKSNPISAFLNITSYEQTYKFYFLY